MPADKDTADAEDLGLHVKADMPTEAGTYEVSYAFDETASQNANYKVTFLPFNVVIKARDLQLRLIRQQKCMEKKIRNLSIH